MHKFFSVDEEIFFENIQNGTDTQELSKDKKNINGSEGIKFLRHID